MASRAAWWAPAPPKFTAESCEWSEDEEEWFPAKGKEPGTGKVREKSAGGKPSKDYSRRGKGAGGQQVKGALRKLACTVTAGSTRQFGGKFWGE